MHSNVCNRLVRMTVHRTDHRTAYSLDLTFTALAKRSSFEPEQSSPTDIVSLTVSLEHLPVNPQAIQFCDCEFHNEQISSVT